MGKKLEISELSDFGKMIAERMEARSMSMFDLVRESGSSPASMSRFLRLQRKPPPRIMDGIITALEFSEQEATVLRRLAQADAPTKHRLSSTGFSRMAHRRFADYDLNALMHLIQSLGWHCELSEMEHDYAYDLKVSEAEGLDQFVAINFPNPRRAQPEALRAGAGAMSGAHQGLQVTLYYEGVAGGLAAFETLVWKSDRQLIINESLGGAASTDAWLSAASCGKGRIIHGGNVIRVLAEYLHPTEKVTAYLQNWAR